MNNNLIPIQQTIPDNINLSKFEASGKIDKNYLKKL